MYKGQLLMELINVLRELMELLLNILTNFIKRLILCSILFVDKYCTYHLIYINCMY